MAKYRLKRKSSMLVVEQYNEAGDTLEKQYIHPAGKMSIVPGKLAEDQDAIVITMYQDDRETGYDLKIKPADVLEPLVADLSELTAELLDLSSSGFLKKKFGLFLKNGAVSNATGNYSATPTDFELPAAMFGANAEVDLAGISVTVKDSQNFSASGYGSANAVANGINIILLLNGSEISMIDNLPIKTNADYTSHGFDIDLHDFGSGVKHLQAKSDFVALFGEPIRMNAATGDKLIVRLNDSFAFLDAHYFKAFGKY